MIESTVKQCREEDRGAEQCGAVLTSLCGVGPDTEHPLRGVQEVASVVEGMEANNISTRHRLKEWRERISGMRGRRSKRQRETGKKEKEKGGKGRKEM